MTATGFRRAHHTPECLQPQEVEQFVGSKTLPEARQRHVHACTWCATLLQGAQPDERGRAVQVMAQEHGARALPVGIGADRPIVPALVLEELAAQPRSRLSVRAV